MHPWIEPGTPCSKARSPTRASRTLREIAAALPGAASKREALPASLASGLAGQALFYAYLALSTADESAADHAADLLERATEELANSPMPPTLYSGFPGVAWTMEHLQGRLFENGDGEEAEETPSWRSTRRSWDRLNAPPGWANTI